MSANLVSLPKMGHLSGVTFFTLVNLGVDPVVVSSAYIDFGTHMHFSVLFSADPTAAANTSFFFTCDQLSGLVTDTAPGHLVNGNGSYFADSTNINGVAMTFGTGGVGRVSCSWTTGVDTAGQLAVNFTLPRF